MRSDPRGKQPERGDHWEVESIAHRDEARLRLRIEPGDHREVARIDSDNAAVLDDEFRAIIAKPIELVGERVPFPARRQDADGPLTTERKVAEQEPRAFAPGVVKGIVSGGRLV
jgi:hypothetical protein